MKFLALFLLVLFSFSATSQADLLEKKGRKYLYKGKQYKCKELSSIYSQSKDAYKLYKSGKRKKKVARIFAYTGLGLLVSGGILGILTDDFNIAVIWRRSDSARCCK